MEDKKEAKTKINETSDAPVILSDEEAKAVNGGHAMGPNVAGVIGTAVAAGTFLAILGVDGEALNQNKT